MIKLGHQLVGIVLVGVIGSSVALAKTVKKQVTFSDPVSVNGTVVKKGTYEAVFDDQSNQLSIVDGHKILAQASAQLGPSPDRKAVYVTRKGDNNNTAVLLSVNLKDGSQATLIDASRNAGGN
jgi:hypothetical protein